MSSNSRDNVCSFKRNSFSYVKFSNLPFIFPRVYASEELELKLNYKERIQDYMNNETSKERLRRMFSRTEYGLMSPELAYILKGSFSCAFVAAMYGAVSAIGQVKADFMRKNVATPYESEFLARRSLTDKITLGAIQGAAKHAVKIGFFSSSYLFITMTASTYNNKITIYEHVATGAFIGSICRINYGLKGIAVSGSLGGFLGLMSGGIILLIMKLSGVSFKDLRYWQHESYWNEFYKKSLTESRERV